MRKSEIRIIQQQLQDDDFYHGEIDGLRGDITDAAIHQALSKLAPDLPAGWSQWSAKRKTVAYLQWLSLQNGLEAGKIDGLYGPQTESAADQLIALKKTGAIPRGFGDITPLRVNPHNFPQENYASLTSHYDEPCKAPLTRVECPWNLRLDWNLKSKTRFISIHATVADSLGEILQKVYETYQLDGIRQLGLDRYGGSFNCRKKRGSRNAWSTHAWGIAIDWYPSRNKLRWDSTHASLAQPELDDWWEIWEQQGWFSLGRREDRDWMHIQAAHR